MNSCGINQNNGVTVIDVNYAAALGDPHSLV